MTEVLENELKYCLYARKSTEGDEKQALSIDSQIKEMAQIAEREKLNIVEIRRESYSAKESRRRPVFEEIVKDIDSGIFNAIITWAPDRLSRNAGDLGKLVDRIDQQKLITIKTFGQNFTNSPSDKFLLLNKVKLNAKLKAEIQKFKKLQAMFLGRENTEKIESVDLKDYAKFVLREGSILEQRSVIGCVSSELVLKSRNVEICA